MAKRKLIVEVIGDSRQLDRTFNKAARSTQHFDRSLGRSARGAIAGSGAFRSLGRSVAFASTAFLGGVGVTAAIKSSVEAAQEQQQSLKSVAAQLEASGKSWKNYSATVERTTNSMVKLGIENDEALRAFTILFRSSNDVAKALRDVQLAADIAGARHIDLSKAALLVGKVETGNTGILRRYGVAVSKTATVEQALAVARRKFAGQAAANVLPQQKFAAVLDRTKEIIGNALLPTLTRYLERLTVWLDKTNRSGELQRKMNRVMETLATTLPKVERGITAVAHAVERVRDAFGGWDNAIKTLGLLVLLLKLRKMQGKAGGKTGAGGSGLAGITALLLGWPAIATVAAATVTNKFQTMSNWVNSFYKNVLRADRAIAGFFGVHVLSGLDKTKEKTLSLASAFTVLGTAIKKSAGGAVGSVGAALGAAAAGIPGATGALPGSKRKEFKLPIALQLAQARAGLTATTKDDVAVAKQIVAFINKLRAARRLAPKALLAALGELQSALGVISDAQKAAADRTREAAKKQADAVKKHAEAVKKAADKIKAAAQEAAQKLRDATQDARDEIGALFQGPILSPTDQQRKAQLGVPGSTIGQLTADTRAATAQFLAFQKNLARIRKRGGSAELISQLQAQGLSAAPEVATIAGAKKGDFNQFLKAFDARERAARKAATFNINIRVFLEGKDITGKVKVDLQKSARHQGRQRRGRHGGQALGLA